LQALVSILLTVKLCPNPTFTFIAGYGLSIIVNLINYGIGRAAQAEPGGLAAWKGMSLFLGGFKT
jgi:hypothetical protein